MKLKNFLLLILLALMWGPSFLFIKVAVTEIPPITLVFARVTIASVFLYILLRLQGHRLPAWGTVWGHIAFVALFHNSLPFVLFSWGEQHVDSALASIVNGTTPIFTILLAHLMTKDDRLTPIKIAGILLGMTGMVFLVAPSLMGGVQASTFGLLAMITAAFCYGLALVYARRHLRHIPSIIVPTGQMLIASITLLPISLLVDRPFDMPMPSTPAILSLLALAFIGTTLAFILYYYLLARADASYVSMVTYLAPIVGVLLGVWVLNEQLTWHTYAGFAFILLGVAIINGFFNNIDFWRVRFYKFAVKHSHLSKTTSPL